MKLSILIPLCFICLASHAQMPTNGLVAHFGFNGSADDSSINKTHGTAYNVKLTSDRFGNEYSAFLFSGESDSYIEFPADNVQNNTYTFSMWALVNSIPSDGDYWIPLNVGSTAGDQSITISNNAFQTYTGWLGGGYNTTGTPRNWIVKENQSVSTRSWAHILCVRDSNFFLLYINGSLVDSTGESVVRRPYYGSGTVRATIGIRNDGSRAFTGKIDDVCIYNRALTRKEIMQIHEHQTSINNIAGPAGGILMYPNVNNSSFSINLCNLKNIPQRIRVSICDMLGRVVYEQDHEGEDNIFQVNSSLTSGHYIVTLRNEDGSFLNRQKIVIE